MGWITLALIFGGVGLSIFGAFLGAERASLLFNAPPMVVLWAVILVALGIEHARFRAGMHSYAQ